MMMLKALLWSYPIWVAGMVFFLTLFICLEVGYFCGRKRSHIWRNAEAGGGSLVLSSMLALLGLLLAFTYSSGVNRHDARKQAVIAEANAIGTAFLRADLVAAPASQELQHMLLEYGQSRIVQDGRAVSEQILRQRIQQALVLHKQMWQLTLHITEQGPKGPLDALLVSAINSVIDYHEVRAAAILDRLPIALFVMLIMVGSACLVVAGFNAGLTGRVSRTRMYALVLVLAGVMLGILDYDRGRVGFIRVSQHALVNTVESMEAALR